jgi:hypothetical protein
LVEIYTPTDTQVVFSKFLKGAERARFLEACEVKIFKLLQSEADDSDDLSPVDSPRIYLADRGLKFNQAYDQLLQQSVLVRPLGRGKMHAPMNRAEVLPETSQLILGVMEIRDKKTRLGIAEICGWVKSDEEESVSIEVDFDLMMRATSPDLHEFPLGLTFHCPLKNTDEKRAIDLVSAELRNAKQWARELKKLKKKVDYLIDTGGKRAIEQTPLLDYPRDIYTPRAETEPQNYKIGENMQVPIQRRVDIVIRASEGNIVRERTYIFGFFDRALRYTPDRNVLRVTGQLIPEGESAEIMLPPTLNQRQQPIFRLNPKDGEAKVFTLTVLETLPAMNITKKGSTNLLLPGSEIEMSINDEVEARSTVSAGRTDDIHKFRLQPLSIIQQELVQKANRSYSACMSINSSRHIVLSGDKYVFDLRHFLNESLRGIGDKALTFEHRWVTLRMTPGLNQSIFYCNTIAPVPAGSERVVLLSGDGIQLDLNGEYLVYLGDFEFSLNLRGTPFFSTVKV